MHPEHMQKIKDSIVECLGRSTEEWAALSADQKSGFGMGLPKNTYSALNELIAEGKVEKDLSTGQERYRLIK